MRCDSCNKFVSFDEPQVEVTDREGIMATRPRKMDTFKVVSHNGWDYWLDKRGIVSQKPSHGYFWENSVGDLPQIVKVGLGITKRTSYVALSCVIETRWQ